MTDWNQELTNSIGRNDLAAVTEACEHISDKGVINGALLQALNEGSLPITRYLVEEQNADPNASPSYEVLANAKGKMDLVKYLVVNGLDIYAAPPLDGGTYHFVQAFTDDVRNFLRNRTGVLAHELCPNRLVNNAITRDAFLRLPDELREEIRDKSIAYPVHIDQQYSEEACFNFLQEEADIAGRTVFFISDKSLLRDLKDSCFVSLSRYILSNIDREVNTVDFPSGADFGRVMDRGGVGDGTFADRLIAKRRGGSLFPSDFDIGQILELLKNEQDLETYFDVRDACNALAGLQFLERFKGLEQGKDKPSSGRSI